MNNSKAFKHTILIGLFVPMVLFILGAYNGVLQTLYRAGVLHKDSVAGINYYQGLTMHGVINALILTTFFAVIFGHVTMGHYLKKTPPKWSYLTSIILMVLGSLLDVVLMVLGKASALYTFYAPLKNSPLFYVGTSLLIVGSWFAFFGWIVTYREWRKENTDSNMPIAVLGTFVNFTMWFVSSLPVAYESLVLLMPWSAGWTDDINVPLTRMLFWMFGHPLVYFWLLPAYIAFYTVLPKVSGGKLYSGNAARMAFLLFLILSTPVGVHHQFSEPVLGQDTKLWVTILTFGVSIPSFMTAFTVGASLEYAGRQNGARGLLGWMARLPWFRSQNYLFGYFICGLLLFIFGGLSGIVNASYSLNQMVHNTGWVPGHFHMTVAGPVLLVILGMSIYMYSKVAGKPIKMLAVVTIVPYIWMLGVALLSHGLMAGGLMGEPRRTNLGLTYTDPSSDLFNSHWIPTTTVTMIGGILMGTAALLYFIAFFSTALSKQTEASEIVLPEAEELHEEKRIGILHNMKPWIAVSVLLTLITYVPSLQNVFKYSKPVENKFEIQSPVNEAGPDAVVVPKSNSHEKEAS